MPVAGYFFGGFFALRLCGCIGILVSAIKFASDAAYSWALLVIEMAAIFLSTRRERGVRFCVVVVKTFGSVEVVTGTELD